MSATTSSSGERPLQVVPPVLVGLRPILRVPLRVVAVLAVFVLFGTSCSEGATGSEGVTGSAADSPAGTDISTPCATDLDRCVRNSSLGDLLSSVGAAVDDERSPVVIGMMNQQNSPAGSYAVLAQAAQAAVDFINSEFGGLGGQRVELAVCDVGFSAEQSVGCARSLLDQAVLAVLGGVDVFGDGIGILDRAGVAFAGGLPISEISAKSGNSFQWSGGAWAAALAFAHDAVEHRDQRVSIVHPDFAPINEAARFGVTVLEAANVKAAEVTFGITDTDLAPAMNAAASSRPDALIVLGADTGCRSAIKAAYDLDIQARKYFLGACAAPSVTDQLPRAAVDGLLFNVEGSIHPDDPDTVLYGAAMQKFAPDVDPVGAATVSFRSVMNLYRSMRSATDKGVEPTRSSIMESLRSSKNQPSFMGHRFTCDGNQFQGLPAMCSPQQILIQMRDGTLSQTGSWIDVGKVRAETR